MAPADNATLSEAGYKQAVMATCQRFGQALLKRQGESPDAAPAQLVRLQYDNRRALMEGLSRLKGGEQFGESVRAEVIAPTLALLSSTEPLILELVELQKTTAQETRETELVKQLQPYQARNEQLEQTTLKLKLEACLVTRQ